ncbi:MAG: MFS transporter [Pseudonocardia sp.]
MTGYLRILRRPRFAALCGGQVVSLFGDALFPMIVLTVAIGEREVAGAAAVVSTAFACRFAALGGLVLFGGGLLDRVDPVRAAAVADALRFVGLLGLAATWDGSLGPVLIGVALLVGACEAVSEPALLIIAPVLAGDDSDDATLAVGLLEAMRSTFGIVGPVLAAGLAVTAGGTVAALVAAGAFGCSAVATFAAGRGLARPSAPDPEPSLLRTSLAGLRIMWTTRWLRWVQLMAVVQVLLAVGPWMVALPLAVVADDGQPLASYGLLLGGFAAGTVVGALVGGRIRVGARGLVAVPSLALFGLTALALDLSSDPLVLTAVFALGGLGTQVFDVLKIDAIRRQVEPGVLGRALSADFFFSFAALPLGQVLGAVALRFATPTEVLRIAGVVVLVTGLLPLLDPDVRRFGTAAPRGTTPVAARPEAAET